MTEKLLLKAAMMQGEEALSSWELFIKNHPLRSDTHPKLLPLVYYNLAIRQKLKTFAQSEALRNIYLTTHAKNLYLLNSFKLPLSKFAEKNIPIIVLKGLAYLTLYYKNLGARIMTDIDILVPEAHFHEAAQILDELGWKTFRCRQLKHYNPRLTHALDYFDLIGNNIDLHCHLLHTNSERTSNDSYWDASEELNVNGMSVKTLCPTDHLIHCCAHGQMSNKAHSMYWVIDALCILEERSIDWERVLLLAEMKAISPFLLQAFQCLNTYVPGSIQGPLIDALKKIPVSKLDQRIFRLLQTQENTLSCHQYLLCNAYRNCKDKTYFSCFIEYLKLITSTDRLTLIPLKLVAKIIRKIAHRFFAWIQQSLSA